MALTKATYSMVSGAPSNVLDYGADPTGVNDSYQAFQDAHDDGSNCLVVPDGIYTFSQPFIISRLGFQLRGLAQSTIDLPNYGALIYPRAGFVGDATIIVDQSSRWLISNLSIEGSKPNNINGIQVTDGPLGSIQNVQVRTADAGIKLINGNIQRWSNIIAEGCNIGFLVEPDVTDNTNGCVMIGLRATLSVEWGLEVLQGAAPNGHSSSYWDISAEGGFQGISVSGGVYCHYELYAESNSGDEFFIDQNAPHYYFLKNIDNQTNNLIQDYAVGWNGTGANLYFDGGFAPDRTIVKSFAIAGALSDLAVKTYVLSNTSSPNVQLNLTLSFLTFSPIGFRVQVYKTDNTAGFALVAPAGISLLGNIGVFGTTPISVMKLEIVKISASQAILVQSGA
jgi:hypothetical protein